VGSAPAGSTVPPLSTSKQALSTSKPEIINHRSAVCCWCNRALIRASGAWWCPSQNCALRQLKFSTYKQDQNGNVLEYCYVPSPKQTVWHEAIYDPSIRRFLFGGAAGPGKSKMLREALYILAGQVPGLHALLLRKTKKDLEQSHLVFMPHECEIRGAKWKSTEGIVEFPHRNSRPSIIRCGYLEHPSDIENYLSAEYDVIVPDELVTFLRDPMLELFTRARSTNPALLALRGDSETEYDGAFVMTASNPGGRGGAWVKDFFIDKTPDSDEFPDYLPQHWAFYEARLKDNPYVQVAGYMQSLSTLRDSRKRQLLDGDWTVFEGQFFDEFRANVHVRDLGVIGSGVARFLSMDWGRNAPGVCLFWVVLPDGHYYVEDEFKFNGEIGNKLTVKDVAGHICRRCEEKELKRVPTCWLDPACWQHTGQVGESIAETFMRYKVPCVAANSDRLSGWQRVHEMFRLAPDGLPWLLISPRCTYGIRTLPSQLQAKNDPDDMDTTGDDHWCDALRYGAVSGTRPPGYGYKPPPDPFTAAWWRQQGQSPDAHLLGSESRPT